MDILTEQQIDFVSGGFEPDAYLVEQFEAFKLGQSSRFGPQQILESITPPPALPG